eukprot:7321173-Alexandrium_andersonii.AAC.1
MPPSEAVSPPSSCAEKPAKRQGGRIAKPATFWLAQGGTRGPIPARGAQDRQVLGGTLSLNSAS